MDTLKITSPSGYALAYEHIPAQSGQATFLWLGGFRSDMQGSKATALAQWAKETGFGFIRFDYSGHGDSEGDFTKLSVTEWRLDALFILKQFASAEPLHIIGSSMGGWIALLLVREAKEKIASLTLIAPAPDFTFRLMWPNLSDEKKATLERGETIYDETHYDDPLPLTPYLFEQGKKWPVLDAPITFSEPVRILQGMRDASVPWKHAQQLVEHISSNDIHYTLIKDGDHSLSRPQDLAQIFAACEAMACHS